MSLGADEILSLFILLVALYIFYKAIKYNWQRWKYINHCELTKAQVIQEDLKALSNENSMFEKKKLRFVNSQGKVVIYETQWIGKRDKAQQLHSDGVEILYDPDNPTDIRSNNFVMIWFWPLFWLVITFLFFMTTLHKNLNNGAIDELISPLTKYAVIEQKYIVAKNMENIHTIL